mmetsp:Transcript_14714/g.41847  ORF Transcript_14714/g.41847 Transcript_14714/m.41847 type:complete len:1106 (+) Transcript_14714:132-3449(+)
MFVRGGYVAMMRVTSRGRGYKGPRSRGTGASGGALQPNCSVRNAASYLRLYPKNFTRYLAFGSTHPTATLVAPTQSLAANPFQLDYSPTRLLTSSGFCTVLDSSSDESMPYSFAGAVQPANDKSMVTTRTRSSTASSSSSSSNSNPKRSVPNRGGKKKATVLTLRRKYENGTPIVMLTAYDAPSARIASDAGVDMILVGDSVGMVVLGRSSTVGVTMEEMIHHCKAVTATGPLKSLVVGDMPFGSFLTPQDAVINAARLMKEGNVDAIKVEGGEEMAPTIKALASAGMVVVGHIGLCPQAVAAAGGFRMQGKTKEAVEKLLNDARALEEAGASFIVIEMVPREVGQYITENLRTPTIGIGAGGGTSGQVLVWHDMLGVYPTPPKFVKQYAGVGDIMRKAVECFVADVEGKAYPGPEHSTPLAENVAHSLGVASSPRPAPADAAPGNVARTGKVGSLTPPDDPELEPVLVLGGGSLGSLFAGRLAQHYSVYMLSGYEDHVMEIQRAGLTILEGGHSGQEAVTRPVHAATSVEDVLDQAGGKFRTIFMLTSGPNTAKRARAASVLLADDGIVVTLQNGLDNENVIAESVSPERVVVGVTNQGALLTNPGEVHHTGRAGETTLLPHRMQLDETSRVKELLVKCGFPVRVESTPGTRDQLRWKKLAVNAVLNPLTALLGVQNGKLLDSEGIEGVVDGVINELVQVARGEGVVLRPEDLRKEIRRIAEVTAKNRSSMLRSLDTGRELEIRQINGAIATRGVTMGIATPVNNLLCNLLQARCAATQQAQGVRLLTGTTPQPDSPHPPLFALPQGFPSSNPSAAPGLPVLQTVGEVRNWRSQLPAEARVGFVPTMGSLHDGHLQLLEEARARADHVVCSIFVNPKQFGPGEDYARYPRSLEDDLSKLRDQGIASCVFAPGPADVFPAHPRPSTYVDVEGIEAHGEGLCRPGFFRGVATVCIPLFNIVRPDTVVFGQKDALQCIVIKKLVRDLHMGIRVVVAPTARDHDGLAMSSRNVYLSSEERATAPALYQALCRAARIPGSPSVADVVASVTTSVGDSPLDLEYATVVDWETGEEITDLLRPVGQLPPSILCAAAKCGNTRILDNVLLHK